MGDNIAIKGKILERLDEGSVAPTEVSSSLHSIIIKQSDLWTSTKAVNRGLTEECVRSLLVDYFDDHTALSKESEECWRVFYGKYHTEDYVMIRPSGNPIDAEGFIKFFTSGKLLIVEAKLVSIDSIYILSRGTAAVATYTVDQTFEYEGNLNEDRCKVTCVIEYSGGQPKIKHENRTPGEPIPKKSRWSV